jgi:membrane-associated protein
VRHARLAHSLQKGSAPSLLNVPGLLSAPGLLGSAGALGLFLAIFAETGLLVGLFLPGDTLLFAAGLLSATGPHAAGHLNLAAVQAAASAGALAGAQAGYLIGRRAGPALLDRPGQDRPGQDRLRRGAVAARRVIDRCGTGRALVLARFVPVARTAISPLAGATGIPVGTFTRWQVTGGLLWVLSITTAGHVLGTRLPGASHYVLPVSGLLVLAFPLPIVIRWLGHWMLATRDRRDQAGGAKNSSAMPSGSRNDTPEP